MRAGSCVATMREASWRTFGLPSESSGSTSSAHDFCDFASTGPRAAIAASLTRVESLRQWARSAGICVSSGNFERSWTARYRRSSSSSSRAASAIVVTRGEAVASAIAKAFFRMAGE